jgi:hypothetical protein
MIPADYVLTLPDAYVIIFIVGGERKPEGKPKLSPYEKVYIRHAFIAARASNYPQWR